MVLNVRALDVSTRFYTELRVEIDHTRDHGVTQSVYFHDPDGNAIEVFGSGHASPAAGLQAMRTQESLGWELVIT